MMTWRQGTGLGVSCWVLVLLAACGGSAPPPTHPSDDTAVAPPSSAEPGDAPASSSDAGQGAITSDGPPQKAEPDGPVGDPVVKVTAPGAEPKSELRYAPKAGQNTTMTMVMTTAITMKVADNAPMPVVMPKMSLDFTVHVASVAPDGTIACDMSMTKAKTIPQKDVQPEVQKKIDEEFGKIAGLKGHAVIDSRGFARELTMDLPTGVDPSLVEMLDSTRDNLRQMSIPLPAEAVGVGAKWDVEQQIRIKGMRILQVTHTTLKSHKGPKFTLELVLEQQAAGQTVHLPAQAAGTTAKLVLLTSKGAGTLDANLSQMTPTKSHMDLKSHSEMEIKQGSQTAAMATDLTMALDVKSR